MASPTRSVAVKKTRQYDDMRVAARVFVDAHGGQYVPRTALLERLTTIGYLANCTKPMKVLAPLLTEWKEFESNRKGGWRLAPSDEKPTGSVNGTAYSQEQNEEKAGSLL